MADAFTVDASSPDLVKFYKAVKEVDVGVQKHLRKRLTNIAKPIAEEVKQAALSLPSKGGETQKAARGVEQMGFRQGIASATQTKVNPTSKNGFSIRIRVSGATFNAKTGKPFKLPRLLEGLSKKPWRHPVFANAGEVRGAWKGKWVNQSPKPYLLRTVIPHKPEVVEEVSKAFLDAMAETGLVK